MKTTSRAIHAIRDVHVCKICLLLVVTMQFDVSLSLPRSYVPLEPCESGRRCEPQDGRLPSCCNGPEMPNIVDCSDDNSRDAYSELVTGDFGRVHHGAEQVEDHTSLVLTTANGTEVSCWEHGMDELGATKSVEYTVQLRSSASCPMKGFIIQLDPESKGSLPDVYTTERGIMHQGCRTVSYRTRLHEVHPTPEINILFKTTKNSNYKKEITFRYIVVYSYHKYVQTSRSFPYCETPTEEPTPSPHSTPCDTPQPTSQDSTTDPSGTVEDYRDRLGTPSEQATTEATESPSEEATEAPSEEETESSSEEETEPPSEEETESSTDEMRNVSSNCGRSNPRSNYTQPYTDPETNIQYTCNLVTQMNKVECVQTCTEEVDGQGTSLCCGIERYIERSRNFVCTACSSQDVEEEHRVVIKKLSFNVPKGCSCQIC